MKLFEIFDKSYTSVNWTSYKDGLWGTFKIDDFSFAIDIQFQHTEEIFEKYLIMNNYESVLQLLNDKQFVRIDYTQILNNEYRYDNTHNIGKDDAIKVLSTIANETATKLKEYQFDIIYFCAKVPEDKSEKNQRLTLYPKIGRSLARKLNMICLSDNSDANSTITMLLKNVEPETIGSIKQLLS